MNNNLKPALEQWRAEQAESMRQEPVAWLDTILKRPYMCHHKMTDKELGFADGWNALRERILKNKPAVNADLLSIAARLALELECLLLDTKDLSVVSKWWDSAHEALDQWQVNKAALYAEPVLSVHEPVAWQEFNEWMRREIPSGTIIGDSSWWASKIFKRFIKSTVPVDTSHD